MVISFIYYVTLSKFVDSSFPQCNVHTGAHRCPGWMFSLHTFEWPQNISIHSRVGHATPVKYVDNSLQPYKMFVIIAPFC